MVILDNPRMVLYIEPPISEKLEKPINDELVKVMEYAIKNAATGCVMSNGQFRTGISSKGVHRTECGHPVLQ